MTTPTKGHRRVPKAKRQHTTAQHQTSTTTTADPLLTYEQVAERLGTTRRFPKRLAEERRIDSVKVGRTRMIRQSALECWIDENTVKALP